VCLRAKRVDGVINYSELLVVDVFGYLECDQGSVALNYSRVKYFKIYDLMLQKQNMSFIWLEIQSSSFSQNYRI